MKINLFGVLGHVWVNICSTFDYIRFKITPEKKKQFKVKTA